MLSLIRIIRCTSNSWQLSKANKLIKINTSTYTNISFARKLSESKMNEPLDVIVFGSAIIDFICYAPRLPKEGETLHGHKFETGFGGKGANQCVAAARLGSKTALIAKLGGDVFGCNYIRQLRVENVNIQHVQQLQDQSTGIAQIAVSDAGENNIIIVPGANNFLSTNDVVAASSLFNQAKVLVCQLETPIEATLEALRKFKGISILNAAPALPNTPQELLDLSSILCINETEAAIMTGVEAVLSINDANVAMSRLIDMGANTVIITLGGMGAVCATRATPYDAVLVPAPIVPKELVVDTTGAGDAFIGALADSIARYPQKQVCEHVAVACKVASQSVQRHGTQSSYPYA